MNYQAEPLLILFALVVGMRHGVDWDHIVAIADITGTSNSRRNGIVQSFLYAIGHASVVSAIALSALFMGLSVPEDLDEMMSRIVGITLLILGFYLLYIAYRQRDYVKLAPRWVIVFYGIKKLLSWMKRKITGKTANEKWTHTITYGNVSAYTIGAIHGIGAETPTQMYIFALTLTAGMRDSESAVLVIMVFALGLIITNTLMGVLGSYGYVKARSSIYKYAAVITAMLSVVVGLMFVFGIELNDPITMAREALQSYI